MSPATGLLIERLQPYKETTKTIFQLCNLSNKLKHDNTIEEVVSETNFSVVKNKPKANSGIFVSGVRNVLIEDSILAGGDIILENTGSAQISNNIVRNIHGMNAKNNTFTNNIIGGIHVQCITDRHLTFDYKNNVLERKTGIDILKLLDDSLTMIKDFSADLYRLI